MRKFLTTGVIFFLVNSYLVAYAQDFSPLIGNVLKFNHSNEYGFDIYQKNNDGRQTICKFMKIIHAEGERWRIVNAKVVQDDYLLLTTRKDNDFVYMVCSTIFPGHYGKKRVRPTLENMLHLFEAV